MWYSISALVFDYLFVHCVLTLVAYFGAHGLDQKCKITKEIKMNNPDRWPRSETYGPRFRSTWSAVSATTSSIALSPVSWDVSADQFCTRSWPPYRLFGSRFRNRIQNSDARYSSCPTKHHSAFSRRLSDATNTGSVVSLWSRVPVVDETNLTGFSYMLLLLYLIESWIHADIDIRDQARHRGWWFIGGSAWRQWWFVDHVICIARPAFCDF